MGHRHVWRVVARTDDSVAFRCACGATNIGPRCPATTRAGARCPLAYRAELGHTSCAFHNSATLTAWREAQRAGYAAWRARYQTDRAVRAAHRAASRAGWKAWWTGLRADPERYAAFLAAARRGGRKGARRAAKRRAGGA